MNQKIKIAATLLCCGFLVLSGCAGRTANPISANQIGDDSRTCASIAAEMSEIEGNINRLLPKESKTGKNVALGVAGLIVWPAWLFMDFKDAEKIEINAYRTRYNHLVRMYNDRHCGSQGKTEIPPFEKPKNK